MAEDKDMSNITDNVILKAISKEIEEKYKYYHIETHRKEVWNGT